MWRWCPTCERCFRQTEWRRAASGLFLCPYPDCAGFWSDAWTWHQRWRLTPELSAIPEPSVRYALSTAGCDGATALFLIRENDVRGGSAHVPDTSGHPICKITLTLSRWRLEERLLAETLICQRCKALQAKINLS